MQSLNSVFVDLSDLLETVEDDITFFHSYHANRL